MTRKLPIFVAILVGLAADPTNRLWAQKTPTAGEVLQAAVEQAGQYRSISATVRHRVDLFGRQLVGTGTYQQAGQGTERRSRLELKIPVANRLSSRLQVCDGEYLWVHETLGEKSQLTQIDIRRIRRALAKQDSSAGAAVPSRALSIGGLPGLLASLEGSFDFTFDIDRRASTTAADPWTLHGRWKVEALAALLPDQADAIRSRGTTDGATIPKHLPDHVVLRLGRRDLLPYEIEYRRTRPQAKSLIVMQWFDLMVDEPIDPRVFVYEPGNIARINGTDRFLKRLGLEGPE